jgi:aminoglycoside 6'-N-acetyltransferase I
MKIRRATVEDAPAHAGLRAKLWPDAERAELRTEAQAMLAGNSPSGLPEAAFVAEDAGRVVGFVEVGLRSHADGCDPHRPVGFLEGWYVEPDLRRRGVGRALIAAAEAWSREQGCREMASDTWIDHPESQRAHAALGFEVVDRCVHFRKPIPR